jgi:hypothetical protein
MHAARGRHQQPFGAHAAKEKRCRAEDRDQRDQQPAHGQLAELLQH